jgi:hypothetical protein
VRLGRTVRRRTVGSARPVKAKASPARAGRWAAFSPWSSGVAESPGGRVVRGFSALEPTSLSCLSPWPRMAQASAAAPSRPALGAPISACDGPTPGSHSLTLGRVRQDSDQSRANGESVSTRLHVVHHAEETRGTGDPDPTPPPTARPTETLHDRDRLRDHRSASTRGETVAARRLDPRTLGNREQDPLGPRCHLRRRPLPDPHRHRSPSHGHPPQRRHRRPTTGRCHQHRRRHPPPRPQRQPTPGAGGTLAISARM